VFELDVRTSILRTTAHHPVAESATNVAERDGAESVDGRRFRSPCRFVHSAQCVQTVNARNCSIAQD